MEIAGWYERMEGLLMLCPQQPQRRSGWDTAALLRSALEHRQAPYTGFSVGEAAYSAWLHDARVHSSDGQSFAMRRQLTEARRGALELVRLLAVQFPDARKRLSPVAGELTQMLRLLESARPLGCHEIQEIARLDGHAIHCLEQILLHRPSRPLVQNEHGLEHLEKGDASCECS